jgi:hypothetical protein
MKKTARLFILSASTALAAILFFGCAYNHETRINVDGTTTKQRSFTPVTPPKDSVVRVEVSSIGFTVGQNPATQQPEGVLGYKRATYTRIPTATSEVYSAAVRATIGVEAGLGKSGGISELLEAGTATARTNGSAATTLIEKVTGK